MAWHGLSMSPLSLVESNEPNHVIHTLHTLLSLLDTSIVPVVHQTHQERDAQTRPDVHHARQSALGERRRRVWPRRRATSSVDPCPRSLRRTLRNVTTHRQDIAIGPRERRRRSPSRRRPPQYWPLPSCVRAHLALFFNAVKRCVTTRTLPARLRHRPSIIASVAASP
jgi:hypothetical protein